MPNEFNPIDGQPWPLSAFLRDSPLWAPSGVVGVPAAAYNAGDLALSFDIVASTSVTPKLSLGRGRSRGGRFERTGSPWASGLSGTAPQQGSAAYSLNTGSNPRIDRLVLRRDAALQAVYPFIIVGTPAASPVKPALTQVEGGVWDTPLHSWTLPGGSSTAPTNITDERAWISPSGGSGLSVYSKTTLDALVALAPEAAAIPPGQTFYISNTDRCYEWTGASLRYVGGSPPPTFQLTALTGWSLVAGFNPQAYLDGSGLGHCLGAVSNTNLFAPGGGILAVQLPSQVPAPAASGSFPILVYDPGVANPVFVRCAWDGSGRLVVLQGPNISAGSFFYLAGVPAWHPTAPTGGVLN